MATAEMTSHRVLVVDDEVFVRDSIKMMLKSEGYAVDLAESGKQALELLENDRFDLIVVDYSMPEMRGDELATLIKQRVPDRPIIMITAYAEMLECSLTPVTGVEVILCKPFMAGVLRDAVARFLPKSRPRDV